MKKLKEIGVVYIDCRTCGRNRDWLVEPKGVKFIPISWKSPRGSHLTAEALSQGVARLPFYLNPDGRIVQTLEEALMKDLGGGPKNKRGRKGEK